MNTEIFEGKEIKIMEYPFGLCQDCGAEWYNYNKCQKCSSHLLLFKTKDALNNEKIQEFKDRINDLFIQYNLGIYGSYDIYKYEPENDCLDSATYNTRQT